MPDRSPLIAVAAILWWTGCGPAGGSSGGAGPPDASEGVEGGGLPQVCHDLARRPDGSCCPAGQRVVEADCAPLGPPECAGASGLDVVDAPAACEPRWCGQWQDASGAGCEPLAEACALVGRACTAAELAAGAGCAAGHWPDPLRGGACAPAGSPPGCSSVETCAEPEWGWMEAAAPAAPRLCSAQELSDGEAGCCPPGQWPDALRGGACVVAGLPPQCASFDACPDADWLWRSDDAGHPVVCSAEEDGCCQPGDWMPPGALDSCAEAGRPRDWCPEGFRWSAGGASCLPDIAGCPADPFGGVAEGPGVVFVDAAAQRGTGDGSRGAPVTTLQAALAIVPSGGTIAITDGLYQAGFDLGQTVTLRGRCAATVVLEAPPGAKSVISVTRYLAAGPAVVRDVTLTGAAPGAWLVAGGQLIGEGLWVHDTRGGGFLLNHADSRVTLSDSVIADVAPNDSGTSAAVAAEAAAGFTLTDVRVQTAGTGLILASTQAAGSADGLVVVGPSDPGADQPEALGIVCLEGAALTLTDTTVYDRRTAAVLAYNFCRLQASGLAVEGTRWDQGQGDALQVHSGASVTIQGARFASSGRAGVYASDPGTRVVATGLLVDASPTDASPAEARGATVWEGASVQLVASRVEGRPPTAVQARSGSEVTLTGVVVRATPGQGATTLQAAWADAATLTVDGARLGGEHEHAVLVTGGARLQARGLQIADAAGEGGLAVEGEGDADVRGSAFYTAGVVAVAASGPGVTVRLAGVRIAGPEPAAGRGIQAGAAARVVVLASALADLSDAGVYVNQGGRAELSGLTVRNTRPGPDGAGYGVLADSGGQVTIVGAWLDGNHHVGLGATGAGTMATGAGVAVWNGSATPARPSGGEGLGVTDGAAASLAGCDLRGNMTDGARVVGDGARLDLQGVRVRDTRRDPSGGFGTGVSATRGASLALQSCDLRANATRGITFYRASGSVRDSVIADVGATGYVPAGGGLATDLGDGVVVFGTSGVSIERSVILACPRAAVLVSGSTCHLGGNVLVGNGLGVVASGSAVTSEQNLTDGRAGAEVADDMDLEVGPAPAEL